MESQIDAMAVFDSQEKEGLTNYLNIIKKNVRYHMKLAEKNNQIVTSQ